MGKKILGILLTGILLLSALMPLGRLAAEEQQLEGTITISGAWALYPMVVKWAEGFQQLHPKVKLDISAGGAGKGMVDALTQVADIGMVSRQIYPEEIAKGAWWVAVTKDAVVPTVNVDNPVLEDLLAKGVTRDILIGIWVSGEVKDWRDVVGSAAAASEKTELHVYTRSDACGAAQTWAEFLGQKQEDLLGIGVYGDPGLAEAVKQDISGIGYNNINYAYDAATKQQLPGIRVLPIDINQNGRIDQEEDFYEQRNDLTWAIAEGKYPSPPARELYFVTFGRPKRQVVKEFIKWVLGPGQADVPQTGYINLTDAQLQEGLSKLEQETVKK